MCLISFKKLYKLSHLNHIKIIWGWNSFLCFTDEETEEQRGLTTCSWSHKIHILIFHKQLSRGRKALIFSMCHWPWCKSFHQLRATKVASLNAELGRGEHNWLRWAALQASGYGQNVVEWATHSRATQLTSSQHAHIFHSCSSSFRCKINTYSHYKASHFKNSKLRFCFCFSVWVWIEVWATLLTMHPFSFY